MKIIDINLFSNNAAQFKKKKKTTCTNQMVRYILLKTSNSEFAATDLIIDIYNITDKKAI